MSAPSWNITKSPEPCTFEKIGTCELCGATDHHLIEGVCPACRPKVTTVQITMYGAPPRRESLSALSRMVAASVQALKGMARTDETIGTCELCGATDHHLIEGVCPTCRTKVTTVQITACGTRPMGDVMAAINRLGAALVLALNAKADAGEESLGAEANVSHVRVPKGRAR